MIDRGVIVTAVAQIGLDFVGISPERCFGIATAGLEQIEPRLNLIARYWCAGRGPNSQSHTGNDDLALDDEPDADGSIASRAGIDFGDFHAR